MATDSASKTSIYLCEYAEKLVGDVKKRYQEKISEIGVDPLLVPQSKFSPECLPPVESMDLLSYLVLDTSFYTNTQFKAFRSLQAYNQMVSGFICSVQGYIVNKRYVVRAKVRHSQRMNDPLVQLWIITNQEGTVISAHCTCMAGLGECCSHIASVLFYIEVWTRLTGKLTCTQVKCTWILPSFVKQIDYAEIKDINFKSAKKLKAEMEKSVSDCSLRKEESKNLNPCEISKPSQAEMDQFYSSLNDCKVKPAVLSLIDPYQNHFVSKTRGLKTVRELFDEKYLKMNYSDLLKECHRVKLVVTEEHVSLIEKETITQSKGSAFYQHRAGRIGASKCYAACHTDPALPSQSLIKTVCYPDIFRFSSAATRHGCEHEDQAIQEYEKQMKLKHENFKVVKCGTIINKEYPYLHATPDFLCSCSCCGEGCGEVKCPYCIDGIDFDSYALKKGSCLEHSDSKFTLKRNHPYYYQVQQQIHTTHCNYCDFVVCAFQGEMVELVQERIFPNQIHWTECLPKLSLFWRICILPEILGRWYTRKLNIKQQEVKLDGDCYCRLKTDEETVTCSNDACPVSNFHLSCLSIKKTPKTWFCPHCRKLPEFKPQEKIAKQATAAKETLAHEAVKLDSICTCAKKAKMGEKLLHCHNENCCHGIYFHLSCLGYKKLPNNAMTTWVCHQCKVGHSSAQSSALIQTKGVSAVKSSASNFTEVEFCNDDDVIEICSLKGTGTVDKMSSLGVLGDREYRIIESKTGWLDCTIIHEAQRILKNINPLIEGFQRPTLGPCKNFDLVTSEFIQIIHTGGNHWVCISSIGCQQGIVNVYDSLFNSVINEDIEEQCKNLLGGDFQKLSVVPVQQQNNGSDCGVFSIAYATSLVFKEAPETIQYDIAEMRTHLSRCLKTGILEPFPTITYV